MSGIVGSKLNIRGSGLVGSLGTDGQHLLSAGAGVTNIFETVSAGINGPSFRAHSDPGGSQNIDSGVSTQIVLDVEDWDTDSAFASNTFTCPSGGAGYYIVTGVIRADPSWATTPQFNVMIYRNGASNTGAFVSTSITAAKGNGACVSAVIHLAESDTLKLYLYQDEGGTEGIQVGQANTFMSGSRIGT